MTMPVPEHIPAPSGQTLSGQTLSGQTLSGEEHGALSVPRFQNGQWRSVRDTVSREETVRILWEDSLAACSGEIALRAWPFGLESLAMGHALLHQARKGYPAFRKAVAAREDTFFRVRLEGPLAPENASGSGTPGPAALFPAALPPSPLSPGGILRAAREFIEAPGPWDGTGCFHRAGVFVPHSGELLAVAEDIGRHNCIDRLAGWSSGARFPLENTVLLTSARLTGSLCSLALLAGFRVLVSRSAVTTEAVRLCRSAGATLIGFARAGENRFTLYTDEKGRMAMPPPGDICGN